MPNPNAYFGMIDTQVDAPASGPDFLAVDGSPGGGEQRIRFRNGPVVYLPAMAPRFHRWALNILPLMFRPVYVTTSADRIESVRNPIVGRVTRFARGPSGRAAVDLDASAQTLYLPLDGNDRIEQTLESAVGTTRVIWVVSNSLGMVIDADAAGPELEHLAPAFVATGAQSLNDIDVARVTAETLPLMFAAATATSCGVPPTGGCVPFNYPNRGCEARAHRMCQLLAAQGVTAGKIWIFDFPRATTSNFALCEIRWVWHVAAFVRSTDGDGLESVLVIDPSIDDTSVMRLSDYLQRVHCNTSSLRFSSARFYQVGADGRGSFERHDFTRSGSQCEDDLEAYREEAAARNPQPPYAHCSLT